MINYRLLGTAQGMDIFHCLYLAGRHCENFFERVVAYYPVKPDEEKFALALCFYEELKIE